MDKRTTAALAKEARDLAMWSKDLALSSGSWIARARALLPVLADALEDISERRAEAGKP